MNDTICNDTYRTGKFSGQPLYAPYFWKQAREGLADAKDGNMFIFDITEKDIKFFPELSRYDIVRVVNDGNFITVEAAYDED